MKDKDGLALEMAKEFKRCSDLENRYGWLNEVEKAEFYMNQKWEAYRAAEAHGLMPYFNNHLEKLS